MRVFKKKKEAKFPRAEGLISPPRMPRVCSLEAVITDREPGEGRRDDRFLLFVLFDAPIASPCDGFVALMYRRVTA